MYLQKERNFGYFLQFFYPISTILNRARDFNMHKLNFYEAVRKRGKAYIYIYTHTRVCVCACTET